MVSWLMFWPATALLWLVRSRGWMQVVQDDMAGELHCIQCPALGQDPLAMKEETCASSLLLHSSFLPTLSRALGR